MLGCSPIKVQKLSKRGKVGYVKRKWHRLEEVTKNKMAKLLFIPGEDLSSDNDQPCSKCKDFERLICLLKDKCSLASRQEQIKLLTLIPTSWSINKMIHEFNVTEHVVQKSRKLAKNKGILADPNPKKGKLHNSDIIEEIVSFYQLDEHSRMC